MKNLLLLLLTILILSCSTNKNIKINKNIDYKNYFLGITKADSLLFIGKPKKAYSIYNDLFKKYDFQNGSTTFEYIGYLRSKIQSNIEITKQDLKLCTSKYGLQESSITCYPKLKKYYEKYGLKSEYKDLYQSYLNKMDLKLRDELVEMLRKDQLYLDNQTKRDSIHKQNDEILKNLFDKNIYPDELVVGNYNVDNDFFGIIFMLVHSSDSFKKSYSLPKVKEFIKQGKCRPSTYASMVDVSNNSKNEPQTYGTMSNGGDFKEEDILRYNKNRKKLDIGLPSMQYEIWKTERYKK